MDSTQQESSLVYFAGGVGSSTIALAAHDYISQCLGQNWKMRLLATAHLDEVVETFRAPQFAGGIVTMPYKKTIIPCLDEVDDLVATTGACNNVYLTPGGKLRGTNTDWIGIKNALLSADPLTAGDCAMIYGAGGASRAAVYALAPGLGYKDIYVVNRDDQEVADLIKDVNNYAALRPNIIHIRSVQQAKSLPSPDYIVSTVPDFPARTAGEINARAILVEFLSRSTSKPGVLLDMCYHPLLTENLKLAQQYGWNAAEGVQVVGHQIKDQWKLWTGQEITQDDEAIVWQLLLQSARSDPSVAGELTTNSATVVDLHSLPPGSRPSGVVRNNGPDNLALERFKLRELAEGWPLYRDSCEWDNLRSIFHPDAYIYTSWTGKTHHEDFIQASQRGMDNGAFIMHRCHGTTTDITLDASRAVTKMKATITQRFNLEGIEVDAESDCRFIFFWTRFRNELTGELEWRAQFVRHWYEKDKLIPVNPARVPILDEAKLAQFPSGYRYLAYCQELIMGVNVLRDLPGHNREKGIPGGSKIAGDKHDLLYWQAKDWLDGKSIQI